MLAGIRSRLTYANVVASIALFVALGGVAWAAATINSKDVIDNSLKSVDLKDDKAVGTEDVKDGSLTPADFSGDLGGDSGEVVKRAIGTTDQELSNVINEYPLTDNTWTQAADETNILFAHVTVDSPPAEADCDMSWRVLLDGQDVTGFSEVSNGATEGFHSIMGGPTLVESGLADFHVVTGQVVQEVTSGAGTCADPNVVTSMQVNVIAFR